MTTRAPALPSQWRWTAPLITAGRALNRAWIRAAQRRQLAQLSAEQLADFGASRADRMAELDKPFWRD